MSSIICKSDQYLLYVIKGKTLSLNVVVTVSCYLKIFSILLTSSTETFLVDSGFGRSHLLRRDVLNLMCEVDDIGSSSKCHQFCSIFKSRVRTLSGLRRGVTVPRSQERERQDDTSSPPKTETQVAPTRPGSVVKI